MSAVATCGAGSERKSSDFSFVGRRISPEVDVQITRDLAARVKNQTADRGTEAALRRNIADLTAGTPDYQKFSPGLAALTRRQWPTLQGYIAGLGALQSITFLAVTAEGADIYRTQFERGAVEWHILLDQDGLIETVSLRTL